MSDTAPDPTTPIDQTNPEAPGRPLNRTITPVAGHWAGVGRGRLAALVGLSAGVVVLSALGWGRERPRRAEPPPQPAR